jgi:hypothetical protein
MNNHRLLIPLLATGILGGGVAAAPAGADVGQGPAVAIGTLQRDLEPVIHATVQSGDTGTYDYTAKYYFKLGAKTVARLPSTSGVATPTAVALPLEVSTLERHEIDVAARHTGHKHVTLTIVVTIPAQAVPPAPAQTVGEDSFLAIREEGSDASRPPVVGATNPENAVSVDFGLHPMLDPVLRGKAYAVPGPLAKLPFTSTLRFTTTGSFTIGTHFVSRIKFSGTATSAGRAVNVRLSTAERHVIRAAARRYGATRVELSTVTSTAGSPVKSKVEPTFTIPGL